MVGGANSSQVSWAKERYSRTSFQVFPLHDLKISNPHLKMFKVTRGRGRPRTARIEASWRRNTPRKPRASQVIAVDAVKEVLPQRKVKQRAARTQIAFKDGRAHLRATATRVAASAALRQAHERISSKEKHAAATNIHEVITKEEVIEITPSTAKDISADMDTDYSDTVLIVDDDDEEASTAAPHVGRDPYSRLKGESWLDNVCINDYFELLTRSAVRHRTRVLSSDALVPIPKSRRNALRAKAHFSRTIPAALKDQDHFQSLTHVFAPVNSSRTHWVLVVLLVKQRIIR
eukprot:m.266362 g.266362  ORF g.266362 m.266362 type:complete len:290 (+) comp15630_c0_seq8:957-1826(+)